jgi:hypothetical protein
MTQKHRKTTLRLRTELVVAARHRALNEGRSMRQVMETALCRYLKAMSGRKEGGNERQI